MSGTILGRGVAAIVLALALGLAAGCSDGPASTVTEASSSTLSSLAGSETDGASSPGVTFVERDADFEWSPAEALPAEDADAIAKFLVGHELQMVLPSQAPVAASLASSSSPW